MEFQYLMGWFIFPFAAYSIATGRNRNAKLWFILGIFIGPVAVLVLAMMKPLEGADPSYHN